jgi:hypothetical protein
MINIEDLFGRIKPGYFEHFDDFVKSVSQFGGGAEDEKYVRAKYFSNAYEVYIYAFFKGLQNNAYEEIIPGDKLNNFWEMSNWNPRELVSHIYMSAIVNSDFDMAVCEHMEEQDLKNEIRKIKTCIEGYANGGLRILSEAFKEEPELAQDGLAFIGLLNK